MLSRHHRPGGALASAPSRRSHPGLPVLASSSAPAAQQQQQRRGAGRQPATPFTQRAELSRRPPRTKPKPFVVRVAGRTSNVKGVAGAIVKRLAIDDMVRVAAIDPDSVLLAMIALTAANNMAQANSGQMLVFQPTAIRAAAAEPPRIPEGSLVMYTSQLAQGEVMTSNTLRVTGSTEVMSLSKAVIARLALSSHTVLECYGTGALVHAVQAVAQARKGLLVRGQDCACLIKSAPRALQQASGADDTMTAAPPAAEPTGDAAGERDSPGRRAPLCHRLVLLECEPRDATALLATSAVGVSDGLLPRRAIA